jgi:hypothetical protein
MLVLGLLLIHLLVPFVKVGLDLEIFVQEATLLAPWRRMLSLKG